MERITTSTVFCRGTKPRPSAFGRLARPRMNIDGRGAVRSSARWSNWAPAVQRKPGANTSFPRGRLLLGPALLDMRGRIGSLLLVFFSLLKKREPVDRERHLDSCSHEPRNRPQAQPWLRRHRSESRWGGTPNFLGGSALLDHASHECRLAIPSLAARRSPFSLSFDGRPSFRLRWRTTRTGRKSLLVWVCACVYVCLAPGRSRVPQCERPSAQHANDAEREGCKIWARVGGQLAQDSDTTVAADVCRQPGNCVSYPSPVSDSLTGL